MLLAATFSALWLPYFSTIDHHIIQPWEPTFSSYLRHLFHLLSMPKITSTTTVHAEKSRCPPYFKLPPVVPQAAHAIFVSYPLEKSVKIALFKRGEGWLDARRGEEEM